MQLNLYMPIHLKLKRYNCVVTPCVVLTHADQVLEELATFFNEPGILEPDYASSNDDWDETRSEDEGIGTLGRASLVGRMMGAGLSVVSRWNNNIKQE